MIKPTNLERTLMRKAELGLVSLAEASRRLNKSRQNVAYRFWNIHVHLTRKGLKR